MQTSIIENLFSYLCIYESTHLSTYETFHLFVERNLSGMMESDITVEFMELGKIQNGHVISYEWLFLERINLITFYI